MQLKDRINCIKSFILRYKYQSLILLVSFISVYWLDGHVLFFWDSMLPLNGLKDSYFSSYIWDQLNGLGQVQFINQYGSYTYVYGILEIVTGGNITLVQTVIVYILLSVSGLSFFVLVNFLLSFGKYSKKSAEPVAFSGSLVYMFNYFTAVMFSQLSPIWFLYSFVPLAVYFYIKGFINSMFGKPYWKEVLYFSLTLNIMSAGLWESPYDAYFILILIFSPYVFSGVFSEVDYIKYHRRKTSFVLLLTFFAIMTNLWWIPHLFTQTIASTASYSLSGSHLTVLNSEFLVSNEYPLKWLSVIALFPQQLQPPGNLWLWTFSMNNIFFISLAIFIVALLYLPTIISKNSGFLKSKHIVFVTLIFVYFALQGVNPLNRTLYAYLVSINFPFIGELYATSFIFIAVPIVLMYSLLFSNTIFILLGLKIPIIRNNTKLINRLKFFKISIAMKSKLKSIAVVILVLLVVLIYPWYLWSQNIQQSYIYEDKSIASSVVPIPSYFYNMSSYIYKYSGHSDVLVLPLTDDFFSVNLSKNTTIADDSYMGYLFGVPTIFRDRANYSMSIYEATSIASNELSYILNVYNIKYIILNTAISHSVPFIMQYNISFLKEVLNSDRNIIHIQNYGPFELYQNLKYNGIICIGIPSAGNPNIFNTIHLNASGIRDIYWNSYFNGKAFSSISNSSISLSYNITNTTKYSPIDFVLSLREPINITKYLFMSLSLRVSKNINLQIYSKTRFSFTDKFGYTILQSLNDTSGLFNPPNFTRSLPQGKTITITVPFIDQTTDNSYSHLSNPVNGSLLTWFIVSVYPTIPTNASGFVNILSINFTEAYHGAPWMFYGNFLSSNHIETNFLNSSYKNFSLNNTKISYIERSPTDYIVHIYNSSSPFALMLKQTYNKDWQAKLLSSGAILIQHFEADSYANGWIVNKTGNFTIELSFSQQKIYNFTGYISIISLLFSLLLLMLSAVNNEIKKRKNT